MASWAGFSEEELRRIQQKDETAATSFGRGRRAAPTNRSRQQKQREKALEMATKEKDISISTLSPDQQLQPPPALTPSLTTSDKLTEPEPKQIEPAPAALPDEPSSTVKELDKQEVELREKNRLQRLQWEQRVIQEKNKRTKALLAKTIAEKSKQTQAEAVKLKKIQKELQVLDDSVSSDIGILRRLIEEASLEYSIAWKRLEKAEAEYVAAKLDLHKKTEAKERLTEHLCAVIQQNELRKARKLEELMLQLVLDKQETTPDTKEEQSKETGGLVHPDTVTSNALKSDGQIQMDSTDVSKDSAVIVQKTSEDQDKEPITATELEQS